MSWRTGARLLAAVFMAVTVLAAPMGSGAASPPADPAGPDGERRFVKLDGVRVELQPGTEQVVTVNHTSGYSARVTLWQLTDSGWRAWFRTGDGRIGYGGLVVPDKRKQGSGATPLGTYRLPWAFGTGPQRPPWKLRYRQIRSGDYWVQDNASAFYNRYRNRTQGGFRWWLPKGNANSSERLSEYPRQYRFAVVTDFNAEQVRRRGAGIFLHVNGPGATAGCVSAPREFMARLMRVLDPQLHPLLAIGR